jgi:DNA helicase-2/ATP-dependent DNA helicase PcrA
MADRLAGMNPEQRVAAQIRDGASLVLAGAGSGKTRVLTHRIAELVDQGVPAWQILAVTFTNKAAGEMRERVAHLLHDRGQVRAADEVMVSTFHSMCVRFLRRDIGVLGYSPQFTIYDDDDQKRLLKQVLDEMGVDPKQLAPAQLRSTIDQAKNRMMGPDALRADPEGAGLDERVFTAWERYEARMRAAQAVDFNDLINLVVRVWEADPAVLARYRRRHRYLLVDEYQDTNAAQFALVRLLAGDVPGQEPHGNVMVVGDDDQSIYGFRGADVRNILDFQKVFPDARVIRLERNYRSTANILAAANAVVRKNRERMEKTLWTEASAGEPLRTLVGQNEAEEAELVVGAMQRLGREGRRWSDFAVIYRTNATSRAFEQALVRARIPHVLVGARKFYDRREVKDVIAYLKLLLNPADGMALERVINVPRRGVGEKSLADLMELGRREGVPPLEAARRWAKAGGGKARAAVGALVEVLDRLRARVPHVEPAALVGELIEAISYEDYLRQDEPEEAADRLANLAELSRALAEDAAIDAEADPHARLQAFLDRASLSGQADELPGEDDLGRVTLLTAHLAKGLEFPVVFVVGLVEGGFPHARARQRESDLEEERRLVYVAFTRARERLYLCRPRERFLPGRGAERLQPSRFLQDVPADVMQLGGAGGIRATPPAPSAEDRSARQQRLGLGAPPPLPNVTAPGARPEVLRAAVIPQGEHRTRTPESLADLRVGVRVLHGSLGAGRVTRVDGAGSNLKLQVHFDSGEKKTLYAAVARLELLD